MASTTELDSVAVVGGQKFEAKVLALKALRGDGPCLLQLLAAVGWFSASLDVRLPFPTSSPLSSAFLLQRHLPLDLGPIQIIQGDLIKILPYSYKNPLSK